LDHDVLALDPPQLAQLLPERLKRPKVSGRGRPGGEIADPVDPSLRLRLGAGRCGEDSPTYRTEESSPVHTRRVIGAEAETAEHSGQAGPPPADHCGSFSLSSV